MINATDNLRHEHFCRPRPENNAPRIERFRADRWASDGITRAGSAAVVRCIERAAQSVDGMQPHY